jgi:hypothetical protein
MELTRLAPNESRAREVTGRLEAFQSVPMPASLWRRVRDLQLLLATAGDHRRVPLVDLLIGATAATASVPLVHYDRDYERLAGISALEQLWVLPDGVLA